MTLRIRLVLAAAYLLVVMAATLAVPLAVNIERRQISEFESGVLGNAAILAARVADDVAGAGRGQASSAVTDRLTAIADQTARTTTARVVVVDGGGRVLADSAHIADRGSLYATDQRPEFQVALFEGRIDSRRRTSESLNAELLVVTVPVVDRNRVVGAVRLSQETVVIAGQVRRSWLGLALVGLIVVVLGVAVAWVLAGSLVRPIGRLRTAAARLGAGELSARADPRGPPETAALAGSFNAMADALAANLEAQRDFLANASHQLRTPITGLRLRLEAVKEEGGPSAVQAEKAEKELERLDRLVDDLLELARASSTDTTGGPVDLAGAAHQAVERWSGPAALKSISVTVRDDTRAVAWTDPSDIAHILDNLIENAIRYSPEGSQVGVATNTVDGRSVVVVADDGPGIPEAEAKRVFERFYRGGEGRRAGPGTGLGLAIVAELVRRWGGDVSLLDGPGTRVQASFRRSPTDP